MRKACLRKVYELARRDERVFFIGSDLGLGTLDEFRRDLPDRFFMEGISEANVMGMAAGLALEGKVVYVNTIATFITRRCLEQVIVDVALHRLPVRLIGNGGGLVYAPLGPTHQATEDIALLRAVPGFTILAPADAREMDELMPLTLDHPGPLYIRLAKGFDPIVTEGDPPFRIGATVPVRDGRDVLLVSTGIARKVATEAADLLEREGMSTAVLHVPTVKPLDVASLRSLAAGKKAVVTVEEHSVIGGLGSAVAEALIEGPTPPQHVFRRVGIPDVFAEHYGSQRDLMTSFGIDPVSVAETVREALAAAPRG